MTLEETEELVTLLGNPEALTVLLDDESGAELLETTEELTAVPDTDALTELLEDEIELTILLDDDAEADRLELWLDRVGDAEPELATVEEYEGLADVEEAEALVEAGLEDELAPLAKLPLYPADAVTSDELELTAVELAELETLVEADNSEAADADELSEEELLTLAGILLEAMELETIELVNESDEALLLWAELVAEAEALAAWLPLIVTDVLAALPSVLELD